MSARRRRLLGFLALAGFLALVAYVVSSTLSMGAVACEVRMVFRGREATVTARGATEADALRAAVTGACARVASGRTENILCLDTPPARSVCADGG